MKETSLPTRPSKKDKAKHVNGVLFPCYYRFPAYSCLLFTLNILLQCLHCPDERYNTNVRILGVCWFYNFYKMWKIDRHTTFAKNQFIEVEKHISKVILKMADILHAKIYIKKLKETKCSYQTTPKVFSSLESTKKSFLPLAFRFDVTAGKKICWT